MNEVNINKSMHLSKNLALPSEAALSHLSELNGLRLSPHFTLGEVIKSKHAEVYNIPSHVAIENLKRVCGWLEELRLRYNLRYACGSVSPPESGGVRGGLKERYNSHCSDHPAHPGTPPNLGGEINTDTPIIINSGYRSPELNKKVGGSPTRPIRTMMSCSWNAIRMACTGCTLPSVQRTTAERR